MSDIEPTINQTMTLPIAEQQEVSPLQKGPGAELVLQREARAWTIEQVAARLNLAPRQIHALETDNFAALPGMACARGFIRAYAKLLKIEADPLLAKIASEAATPLSESGQTRRALSTPFSDNVRFRAMNNGHGVPSKLTLFLLLAVLLIVSVFAGYQMGWIPAILKFTPLKVQSVDSASGQAVAAQEMPKATTTEMANTSDAAPNPNNTSSGNATEAANTEANTNTKVGTEPLSPSPIVPAVANDAPITSNNTLVFTSNNDSWVEVKRANGNGPNRILISRMIKAGSTAEVEITEPVSVTIGNAAGVEVSLRGTPVDVKSGMKNNVTRLNLK